MGDIEPIVYQALVLWPLWKENRVNPAQLTLKEVEIVQAFDAGMNEYLEKNAKAPVDPNTVVMGGIPESLTKVGEVSLEAFYTGPQGGPPAKSNRVKRRNRG